MEKNVWLLHGFFLVLTVFSFRHVLILGDHLWTGEGTRLSWSMRLNGKYCHIEVKVKPEDPWLLPDVRGLTPIQRDNLSDPYLFLQYAKKVYCPQSHSLYGSMDCRAVSHIRSPLIRTDVDLCTATYKILSHNEWILPLPGPIDPHYLDWLKVK